MFVLFYLITIALDHDPISRQSFKLFHYRHPVHAHTVRRRIRVVGLRCCNPKKGCILTNRHKVVRLTWARAHLRLNRGQWGSVLFTDESKFNVQNCAGRTRVYRNAFRGFRRIMCGNVTVVVVAVFTSGLV